MLDLNGEPEEVIADIMPVIENVTTGLVTYSVRDTEFNGFKIKKNDYIGICDNKIVATGKRRSTPLKACLRKP